MDKVAIGIDLGTYNCAASYVGMDNETYMIKDEYGQTVFGVKDIVLPSFIKFNAEGAPEFWFEEARRKHEDPHLRVWGVKRLIGRAYSTLKREETKRFLYRIREGMHGMAIIDVGPRSYTPVDISSMLLQKIKEYAKNDPFISSRGIGKAFITYPAYFDPDQISLTKEAAEKAGFSDMELIPEPEAATLAYSVQLNPEEPQIVMVIDWGAGTLDMVVSVVKLDEHGVLEITEALPAYGNIMLGGIDMDDTLLGRAIELYRLDELPEMGELLKEGKSRPGDPRWSSLIGYYDDFRSDIESAKIELSTKPSARRDTFYQEKLIPIKMARTLEDREDNREDWIILEETLLDKFKEARDYIEFFIQNNNLDVTEIDHLILVGGPMLMPCVQRMIADIFKDNQRLVDKATTFEVSPMECVAQGAALAASGKVKHVLRKATRSYGVYLPKDQESGWGEILIPKSVALPYERKYILKGLGQRVGQGIQVSIYSIEEVPEEGNRFTKKGDYRFYTAIDQKGSSHFSVDFRADKYGCIDVTFSDLLTTGDLTLKHFYNLKEEEINPPLPILESSKDEVEDDKGRVPQMVPEEHVKNARRMAEELLKDRSIMESRANIRYFPSEEMSSIKKAYERLEDAMNKMPHGASSVECYKDVMNRYEELGNILETMGLLNEEEILRFFSPYR